MKLVSKIVVGLFVGSAVAAGSAYAYVESGAAKSYADHPRPAFQASSDPAVIAHGEYMVRAVAHCSSCHGPGELVKRREDVSLRELVGGYEWDVPSFGRFYAANITSDRETGIGGFSDGELARVLRSGVGRSGALLPLMLIGGGPMADEDITAVISYLRTLAPSKRSTPEEELAVVGKLVLSRMSPRSGPAPQWVAPGEPSVERGRYLANGPAACVGCHSETDPLNGFAVVGAPFAGSPKAEPDLLDPTFELAAPNLTPDAETGHLATWSEDAFVSRMRAGPRFAGSTMPWNNFAHLRENDVRSLYRYLRSLAPVKRNVGPTRRPVGYKPE